MTRLPGVPGGPPAVLEERTGSRFGGVHPLHAPLAFAPERTAAGGVGTPRDPHPSEQTGSVLHFAEAHARGLLAAFDLIGCGAVLLGSDACVIELNRGARLHIGCSLTLCRGQLRARETEATAALRALIASVLCDAPGREPPKGAVALPRPDRHPLIVKAAAIDGFANEAGRCVRAILVLIDPDQDRTPTECILKQAFGLTCSEARIALRLAQGQDVREIAAALGISEGTVRTHLKAIFAKTDTHRQAELAALLGRLSLS